MRACVWYASGAHMPCHLAVGPAAAHYAAPPSQLHERLAHAQAAAELRAGAFVGRAPGVRRGLFSKSGTGTPSQLGTARDG